MSDRKKLLYVASTAQHLERFHKPYLAGLRENFDVFTMANGEGVDFPIPFAKSTFSPANLRAVVQIRRILKEYRFDRVVVNTSLAAFLVRLALPKRNRPVLLNVVHGYLFSFTGKRTMKDRLLLFCEEILRKKTDAIAVMNREDEIAAKGKRLCLGEVSFLHGMGLVPRPIPEKNLELRTRYAKSEEILLTFVGELSRRKNQADLISLLASLRSKGLAVRLLLAGEGKERPALEAQANRLGVSDFVSMPGNLSEIPEILTVTDLYLSASASEGLPFNLLEAMEAGLPILATDVRGQKDLLEGTGRLVPLGNLSAMETAVEQALLGPLGAGSVEYPNLSAYLLPSVFDFNLRVMQGEL